MPEPIKAITVNQPWATLLALGEKEYETRGWATKYRGPIAIHAGKDDNYLYPFAKWLMHNYETNRQVAYQLMLDGIRRNFPPPAVSVSDAFPLGAIVAVGELVAIHMCYPPDLSEKEAAFGVFGVGRVAWQIANVRRLETPIPASGKLGLWEWTPPDGFDEWPSGSSRG